MKADLLDAVVLCLDRCGRERTEDADVRALLVAGHVMLADLRRLAAAKAEAEARFADPSRVITGRDYADLLDALP